MHARHAMTTAVKRLTFCRSDRMGLNKVLAAAPPIVSKAWVSGANSSCRHGGVRVHRSKDDEWSTPSPVARQVIRKKKHEEERKNTARTLTATRVCLHCAAYTCTPHTHVLCKSLSCSSRSARLVQTRQLAGLCQHWAAAAIATAALPSGSRTALPADHMRQKTGGGGEGGLTRREAHLAKGSLPDRAQDSQIFPVNHPRRLHGQARPRRGHGGGHHGSATAAAAALPSLLQPLLRHHGGDKGQQGVAAEGGGGGPT